MAGFHYILTAAVITRVTVLWLRLLCASGVWRTIVFTTRPFLVVSASNHWTEFHNHRSRKQTSGRNHTDELSSLLQLVTVCDHIIIL